MTNINDLLNHLFPRKGAVTHKENYTQSPSEEERVRKWMVSLEGNTLLDQLFHAYRLKKAGISSDLEVHLLDSPYANGFALTYSPSMSQKTFSDLFFAFGLRMLDLGYYRVSLDKKIGESANFVKTTEKQYFKPCPPAISVPKMIQRYGNVSIEKDLINDKPVFLKILVTVYSGHHYHDALPFAEFMDDLFKA